MATMKDIQKNISKAELTKTDAISEIVNRLDVKRRFEEVLGKKAPGFISSILSLTNSKPALKTCEPKSILSAAMIAATMDLPINANLGFAHLVPYNGVAQFQMGWKGFVQLAIRTGLYKTMNAAEIYEGELIQYNRVTGEVEIDENKKKSDKIVAYVAYFKLNTGFEKYLLMTTEQVTKHGKRYSKAFSAPTATWQTNFDAMALKTVLKLLLSKYGVLSVEMQRAITLDQGVVVETPEGEVVEFPDGPSEEATPVIPATETEPGFIATRALFPEEESTDPIHPT